MDPCFVAPELLLWPVAKPSLSLQAPNLQAQLLALPPLLLLHVSSVVRVTVCKKAT